MSTGGKIQPRGRAWRALGSRLTVVMAIAATLLAVAPASASAQVVDGMRTSSSIVYRIDPSTPAVFVDADFRFTNVTPNRDLGGGSFEFFFFETVVAPVGPGATDVAVTVNGNPATFEITDLEGFAFAEVDLGYDLRYNRTAEVNVTWTIAGAAPRTEDDLSRVNDAHAAFPVIAHADPGLGEVRVEAPRGWEYEHVGDELARTDTDDAVVFSAVDIEEPLDFWAFFTARNNDFLTETPVNVGDADFVVRSWPDDTQWRDFAVEQINDGLPALERIIGVPWPPRSSTDVIESSTPYLLGYGGWYSPVENAIEVGEDLNNDVFLHELAHGWFNGLHLDQRWMVEGVTELVAQTALDELGVVSDEEPWADIPQEEFQLSEWDDLELEDGSDPREAYGYAESFAVMQALADEIGDEQLTVLLQAIINDERAYQNEDGSESQWWITDWRSLIDLAEQVGGATEWDEVVEASVLTDAEAEELTQRDTTVEAYDELVEAGSDWFAPPAVRDAMAQWDLDVANDAIDAATVVLDERSQLADVLDPVRLDPAQPLEETYETSNSVRDLDDLVTTIERHRDEATTLVANQNDLVDLLESAGLDAPALTQAAYDDDAVGVVDRVVDDLDDARELTEDLDELATLTERYDLSVPPLAVDAFVTDRVAASEEIDQASEAVAAVGSAAAEVDAADSIVERIGAIGGDADGMIDDAADALNAGEFGEAIEDAQLAVDEAAEFGNRGWVRVGIAAAAVIVLALATLLILRRRRRHAVESPDDPHVAELPPDSEPVDSEPVENGPSTGNEPAPDGEPTDDELPPPPLPSGRTPTPD